MADKEAEVQEVESLDDVFSNAEPEEARQEAEKEAEPEEAEGEEPEESGDEGSPPEPEEKGHIPIEALLNEREKRQKYERELEELKKQLDELHKKPEKKPDIFEDPEGYDKGIRESLSQAEMRLRFDMDRASMMRFKPDYLERESEFIEMVKEQPALAERMKSEPYPAQFAYEQAEKARKLKELENVDDLEAKIRAEVEEKVRAEYEAKHEKADTKRSAATPSLASAGSKGKQDTPVEEDLADILGR